MPTTQGTFTVPNSFVEQYDLGQKKIRADLVDENFTDVANAITTNITNISTAQTTADNAATAAAGAQSTANSAVAAAAAATTTTTGTARLATQAEVQAGSASTSPLPAVLNVNNARDLPKATDALFGLGRSATDAEATAGTTTSGTGPAWVTPEQLASGLAGKTDAKVALKGTRTEGGDWTITGLTIGKPLYVLAQDTTNATVHYTTLKVTSGADGGRAYGTASNYQIGSSTSSLSTDVFVTIPTDTTVVIKVFVASAYMPLVAYQ